MHRASPLDSKRDAAEEREALTSERARLGPGAALRWRPVAIEIDGVHHITLRVSDLERSRSFYAGVLGLVADQDFPGEKLRFRLGAYTRLVLHPPLPGTPSEDRFSERSIGLDHLSLGVRTRDQLDRLVAVLRRSGVRTEGVREPGVVNFRDPDGVAWECYEQG
jgi:glyoxylase I family protein